ncbi:MAG: MMPL family transporter [Bacteroidales bacterium]|nr:MMPL family transporter [Bacteroidales bacterium]
MKKFFLSIYRFFCDRQWLMWLSLVVVVAVAAIAASRVRLDENISSFFPSSDDETDFVMSNMKAMDKIAVMVSHGEEDSDDIYELIDAATELADTLDMLIGDVATIDLFYDDSVAEEVMQDLFNRLPVLMTDSDYDELDSLTSSEAIGNRMAQNAEMMLSPMSTGLTMILPSDPIGIAGNALMRLQKFGTDAQLDMFEGSLVSHDHSTVVMFVNVGNDFGNTGDNEQLVKHIRSASENIAQHTNTKIYAYGAPIVAVSNSSQVKKDETITVSIALIITALVFLLAFRRKRSVLIIMLPVLFGGLFAFAIIGLLGKELSLISIGAGATVLGLAMSYSIHMLTHSLHSGSTEQLIEDMAYPMTVGSITTIGAFLALMFTDSKILQDLGLFASMTLVGTLLFCMIFLPHFIVTEEDGHSRTMKLIQRISSYDYASNKWLVGSIVVLTVVGFFFFTDVRFEADMNNLNYRGDDWIETSKSKMENILQIDTLHHSTIVATGESVSQLAANSVRLAEKADSLRDEGLVEYSSIAPDFLVADEVQQKRIDRWNAFWTSDKKKQVLADVEKYGQQNGFRSDAFDSFCQIVTKDYSPSQPTDVEIEKSALLKQWISNRDGHYMLYANIAVHDDKKDYVMQRFDESRNAVVADMGYFVRKATQGIVDNFNFILAVSSILVGLVLFISYGRIELFLLTFLPMCISWVIILGLMAIFGIEFNIVNIILSTFIFGVGDDFSIFIMDGLLEKYRNGKEILNSHKTAIALSAFAIFVGLGVQVFAEHPGCKSIGMLSIFGLVAVILTSYTVQPILFRILVTNASKKGHPYTLFTLMRSAFFYSMFLFGCILGYIVLGAILILPFKLSTKKRIAHSGTYSYMNFFFRVIGRIFPQTRIGEIDLEHPSVIIANHQSFVDIINVLALSPKIVCITKSWAANSPIFGILTRYCDSYNVEDGWANMVEKMRPLVADGYSIVVFPEGTRSVDGQIHRFHNGAFFLAEQLGLDISPMVIFGNGMVASKMQPFNIKDGWLVNKFLPRLTIENDAWTVNGESIDRHEYKAMARATANYFRQQYDEIRKEYDTPENPYYNCVDFLNNVYR